MSVSYNKLEKYPAIEGYIENKLYNKNSGLKSFV